MGVGGHWVPFIQAALDLPAPEAPPQTSGFTEQEMETPV